MPSIASTLTIGWSASFVVTSQCSAAFPRLHDRIDAAVGQNEHDNSPVTHDEIRIAPGRCMLKVLIYDDEVSFATQSYVDVLTSMRSSTSQTLATILSA